MRPEDRYPALSDLRARARRRLPHFVWEFLDSGTGTEKTRRRNRTALDARLLMPSILHGEITPDLRTDLLGQTLPLPFGIAPVGMSGLIWPDAEGLLARAAAQAGIPYCLSTVASRTPEDLAPHLGDQGWFQIYPPRDPEIRTDMLRRARDAGFRALVLTVDVPVASRRERQVRAGLTTPPRLTPRLLAQIARCPAWAIGMARMGLPRMRLIDSYAAPVSGLPSTAHAGYLLRSSPDWRYLADLRAAWDGPMLVKGVMRADDARKLQAEGIDAIWVSNHAGRQFDAAPATIDALAEIRAATTLPILLDSGFETGLDILRGFALGADFIMLGRAWHYALAALGRKGPAHLVDILRADLLANMGQLGVGALSDMRSRSVGLAGQAPPFED